jgi:hypothetical protein
MDEGGIALILEAFYLIIYIFALYGVLSIVSITVKRFCYNIKLKSSDTRIVLLVKNKEDVIEGIIKSIFKGEVLKNLIWDNSIYVVDMGSKDATVNILKKLKKIYTGLETLEIKDRENIFHDFL